jgi:hypothetical protein
MFCRAGTRINYASSFLRFRISLGLNSEPSKPHRNPTTPFLLKSVYQLIYKHSHMRLIILVTFLEDSFRLDLFASYGWSDIGSQGGGMYRPGRNVETESKFLGDTVGYGIGLSHRSASLTGRYDNPMP